MLIFLSTDCKDTRELAERADVALGIIGRPLIGDIGRTDDGAPVCGNWNMSVTHTDGIIMLALSDKPVGIDVEKTSREVPPAMRGIENWTAYEANCKLRGNGIKMSEVRQGGDHTDGVSFHYFLQGYTLAVAGGDGTIFVVCV